MHMLPEEVEKVEGAHNYRQVVGFPVFGVGQPSPDGVKAVLEKVKASGDDKTGQEYAGQHVTEPIISYSRRLLRILSLFITKFMSKLFMTCQLCQC